jgi:tetratricopeptide (TPR) repeat protein
LAIAKRGGDTSLELRTLSWAATIDLFHTRYQAALEKSQQAIALCQYVDDESTEAELRFYASTILLVLGNPDGARPHTEALLSLAQRLRSRLSLTNAFLIAEVMFRATGDLQTAIHFSERGLAVEPTDDRLLQGRVTLEYELGEFSRGAEFTETLLESRSLEVAGFVLGLAEPAGAIPVGARISGILDRLQQAEAIADQLLSVPSVVPLIALLARVGKGLSAVIRENGVAAAEQYAEFLSVKGTMSLGCLIAMDRLLGLLSQTMGNLDQAMDHFDDSLAFCRKAGYRPELAWTCCDYADTLLQRGDTGDREKATSLLDESLAISSELGMRPLMERVISRQDGL